jgi:hypothetical protein
MLCAFLVLFGCGEDNGSPPITSGPVAAGPPDPVVEGATQLIEEGRRTFRFDTFGDEAFWGGQLELHRAIEGAANGGVGPGLSPTAALGLGLKVDAAAIPSDLAQQIRAGQVNLDDPATTLALLRINAVVGITGFFSSSGELESVGIQCALCHSTVDNSFAPGIGQRLDGWPNRDLNVGEIIALSPNLSPFTELLQVDDATVRAVLRSWGPGKFDAELILDGRATQPNGRSAATLLPAAFGLRGVNLHTYTGWGSITHWNAFVANLEMHGIGNFYDPRLDDATKFPIAARARLGHITATPAEDRITSRLGALQFYQLSLPVPTPPAENFDAAAAQRGSAVFEGRARCASCHIRPIFSEPGWNMHTAEEIGIDDFQASRSPDNRYRTTPLGGLFTRAQGGFYHDGRFPTLEAVVAHYEDTFHLGLTASETSDLIEYLKSL